MMKRRSYKKGTGVKKSKNVKAAKTKAGYKYGSMVKKKKKKKK